MQARAICESKIDSTRSASRYQKLPARTFAMKGGVAKWLGTGLQNRIRRFNSARHLQILARTPLLGLAPGVRELMLICRNGCRHENLHPLQNWRAFAPPLAGTNQRSAAAGK